MSEKIFAQLADLRWPPANETFLHWSQMEKMPRHMDSVIAKNIF